MAYDPDLLVRWALGVMKASPATPIAIVAQASWVDRAMLARAFRQAGAGSPADVRRQLLVKRLEALMTHVPPRSIKGIAEELGFTSPQSLQRWIRRGNGVVQTTLRRGLCRRIGEAPRTPGGSADRSSTSPTPTHRKR